MHTYELVQQIKSTPRRLSNTCVTQSEREAVLIQSLAPCRVEVVERCSNRGEELNDIKRTCMMVKLEIYQIKNMTLKCEEI